MLSEERVAPESGYSSSSICCDGTLQRPNAVGLRVCFRPTLRAVGVRVFHGGVGALLDASVAIASSRAVGEDFLGSIQRREKRRQAWEMAESVAGLCR